MSHPVPEHFCISYCEHGGVCVLERGHTTKHNSDYCEWTDAEAIPRADADALVYQKNPEIALLVTVAEDIINFIDPPWRDDG